MVRTVRNKTKTIDNAISMSESEEEEIRRLAVANNIRLSKLSSPPSLLENQQNQ